MPKYRDACQLGNHLDLHPGVLVTTKLILRTIIVSFVAEIDEHQVIILHRLLRSLRIPDVGVYSLVYNLRDVFVRVNPL